MQVLFGDLVLVIDGQALEFRKRICTRCGGQLVVVFGIALDNLSLELLVSCHILKENGHIIESPQQHFTRSHTKDIGG